MRKKEDDEIGLFPVTCSWTPVYSKVCLRVFCELLGSIILLGLGGCSFFGRYSASVSCMVNSKFPWPSLNRENYRILC